MRASKVTRFVLAILFVLTGCYFLFSTVSRNVLGIQSVGQGCAGDFGMRYNEICCAHAGINSYRIWTREISSDRWQGHDNPKIAGRKDQVPGKEIVHAYPPWHHVLLWPMGYLSRAMATALLYTLMGVSLAFLWHEFRSWSPKELDRKCLYWSTLFMFVVTPVVYAWTYGNYGVLLAALSVMILRNIDNGNQVVGGLLWSLLMVKPQVGILFFWPLLFRRRYVTILSAMVICLGSAVVMGWNFGESPFELIMQIPKIGEPWVWPRFWPPLKLCPNHLLVARIEMIVCFAACGALCFLFRQCSETVKLLLPVAFFLPIWTYSNVYDHVVCWPVYFMLCVALTRAGGLVSRRENCLILSLIGIEIARQSIDMFAHFSRSLPTLISWTCSLSDYFLWLCSLAVMFILISVQIRQRKETWRPQTV